MSQPLFEKVAFIGLGLIGSSLARVIKAEHLANDIVASTRSQNLGRCQGTWSDFRRLCRSCRSCSRCRPGGAGFTCSCNAKVLETVKPYLAEGAIITDVGSTKGNVVEAAKAVFGENLPAGFVPGHPIAGAEHTGVHAGKVDLFANHKVILTPLPSSGQWAVEKLIQLWQAAKAEVICMDVEKHDEVLAHTSHLPHLMAFNLVEQLAKREDNLDIFVMLPVASATSRVLLPVIHKCGMTSFCQ